MRIGWNKDVFLTVRAYLLRSKTMVANIPVKKFNGEVATEAKG